MAPSLEKGLLSEDQDSTLSRSLYRKPGIKQKVQLSTVLSSHMHFKDLLLPAQRPSSTLESQGLYLHWKILIREFQETDTDNLQRLVLRS
jgi:hypothetical protein